MYYICATCKLVSKDKSFICPICNKRSNATPEESVTDIMNYTPVEHVFGAGQSWGSSDDCEKPDSSESVNDSIHQTSQSANVPFFFDHNEMPNTDSSQSVSQGEPFFDGRNNEVNTDMPRPVENTVNNNGTASNNTGSLGRIHNTQNMKWNIQEAFSWCQRHEAFRKIIIAVALFAIIVLIISVWNNRDNIFSGLLSGISSLLPMALFVVIIVYAIKKLIKP